MNNYILIYSRDDYNLQSMFKEFIVESEAHDMTIEVSTGYGMQMYIKLIYSDSFRTLNWDNGKFKVDGYFTVEEIVLLDKAVNKLYEEIKNNGW